jgi:hypothetical protein
LHTPAPDLNAILTKAEMFELHADPAGFGFADPGYVAYTLTCARYDDLARAVNYLDILRLVQPGAPLLRLSSFDPGEWVAAYEDTGGAVSSRGLRDELVLVFPEDDSDTAEGLRAELAETPWKYRAVALYSADRQLAGGDPYFAEGRGDRRPTPRDGAPRVPVARALRVSFVARDDVPTPVVEEIDNRDALAATLHRHAAE